jgi:hypothetical protein
MVIDGKFTKIVYSDSVVSLNGLYIYCPLESDQKPVTKKTKTSYDDVSQQLDANASGLCSNKTTFLRAPKVLKVGDPPLGVTDRVSSEEAILPLPSSIVTKKIPFIFSLLNPTNIYLIKELNRIEHEIIEHYKEFFQIHKTNVYSLRNQLKSGNIKVVHKIPFLFGDYESISVSTDVGHGQKAISTTNFLEDQTIQVTKLNNLRPIVVKISGIWETNMNIGITFKFQI